MLSLLLLRQFTLINSHHGLAEPAKQTVLLVFTTSRESQFLIIRNLQAFFLPNQAATWSTRAHKMIIAVSFAHLLLLLLLLLFLALLFPQLHQTYLFLLSSTYFYDKTTFRLNTMQCTLRRHRPEVNLLLFSTKLGLIIIFLLSLLLLLLLSLLFPLYWSRRRLISVITTLKTAAL